MYESNHFAQFDLGSATQYFCLRAAELGLGTCVLGAFNEEKVKTLLQIPVERHVFVMLAVGYPVPLRPLFPDSGRKMLL